VRVRQRVHLVPLVHASPSVARPRDSQAGLGHRQSRLSRPHCAKRTGKDMFDSFRSRPRTASWTHVLRRLLSWGVGPGPCQQIPTSGLGRRERSCGRQGTQHGEDSGNVDVLMRIHAQNEFTAPVSRCPAVRPWAAASCVSAPVATTTAVALPEETLLPWKHSCGCSNIPMPSGARTSRCRPVLEHPDAVRVEDVRGTLHDGRRFPRQHRLMDGQSARAQQSHICRDQIARAELDDVAGDQLIHRNLLEQRAVAARRESQLGPQRDAAPVHRQPRTGQGPLRRADPASAGRMGPDGSGRGHDRPAAPARVLSES
jgi:hypothetical protein